MVSNIYHERQTRQLCALHALNNLFQCQTSYTKEQLDEICVTLSPKCWINPHKSMLGKESCYQSLINQYIQSLPIGLGNYDINVIMTALQKKSCEAIWFDKRKDPSCINTSEIIGFILNVPSDFKFAMITLPLQRRHWYTIRKVNENYYNLDSKLERPQCIGHEEELITYLRSLLAQNDCELFIVVEHENGNTQKWLKEESIHKTE